MISAEDSSLFKEWDRDEQNEPSPRKIHGDKIIYRSLNTCREGYHLYFGDPVLSDFGEGRIGDIHEGLIQPSEFRAPEVILRMKWTQKVDIWNLGLMVSVSTLSYLIVDPSKA